LSLLDTYRRNIQRKREEILRLQNERAREQKKRSDIFGKIQRASDTLNRTKNQSTVKTKLNEIKRYEKQAAYIDKKIAGIDSKIDRKNNELNNQQKKLEREEHRDIKKRNQKAERRVRDLQKNISGLGSKVSHHSRLHSETQSVLDKLHQLPEKIVVLFLASNPLDQESLRLDEEARAINEMIRKSEHRDSVKLESSWAVRPSDILQALNEHTPAIVHFSGHGSDQDELVFQNDDGNTKLVTKDAIVQTMMASSGGIRLVFFNTCYSRNQAEAVVEHVETAIGMKTGINDEAARFFAAQFYSSIGFGLSVKKAFEQAIAALMLEGIKEEDKPELFVQDGLSADEIIIVKPQNA